jgi:hypothetical protein
MKAIFLAALTIVVCGVAALSAEERQGQRPRETTKLVLYDPAEVKPYVSYLEEHAQPPVDYVMELFNRFDLVILGERTHPEITQWEFIYQLTSDPRFVDQVGHIFTEYGSATIQPSLEELMNTDHLQEKEVQERVIGIMRRFPIHPVGWVSNNFFDYLTKLYRLNQSLPEERRISLIFSDGPWEWEGMTKAQYDAAWQGMGNRDRTMADRIESEFKRMLASGSKTTKALVVMNTRHAFLVHFGDGNTGAYLAKKFPGKVASVMLNYVARDYTELLAKGEANDRSMPETSLMAGGKWDAAFWMRGNVPCGFDFDGSPFGRDQFDYMKPMLPDMRYENVFTGMVFWEPLDKHMIGESIPGYFDKEFKDTVVERARLQGESKADWWKERLDLMDQPQFQQEFGKRREHRFTLEFKTKE